MYICTYMCSILLYRYVSGLRSCLMWSRNILVIYLFSISKGGQNFIQGRKFKSCQLKLNKFELFIPLTKTAMIINSN